MTRLSLCAGIAALTLLSACGEQAPPPVNITTVEVDNTTNVTVPEPAAEPADNAAAANAAAANTAEAAAPALALAPDGLTIVLDSGSTRHVNFGTARGVAVPMVVAVLGKPAGISRNSDCGQGPMEFVTFKGGLDMEFQDGKFVGWDIDERQKAFTLMNGIGIGSSLKALREAFSGVTVENSTLGDEFSVGELGGLLTSLKPDATITHLWAGSTCQFR